MAIDRQQSGGAEAFFGGAALGLLGQAAGQDYLTPYLDQLKEQRETRSRFLGQQALLTASIARGGAASSFLTESFPGMELEDIVGEVSDLDAASFNTFYNGLTQHVNTAGEVENAAAMIIPGLPALQADGFEIPEWFDINNLTEAMVHSMTGAIAAWKTRVAEDVNTMGTLTDIGETVFSGFMADTMKTDPEVVMHRVNQMNEQGGNIANDDLRALYRQSIATGLSKWEAARQVDENGRFNDLINRRDFSGPGWEGGPSINDLVEQRKEGDPNAAARLANAGFDDFTQKMSDRHSEIKSLHDLGIDMAQGWQDVIGTKFDSSNTSNLLKLAQVTDEEVKTVVRIHDNKQKRTAFTGAAAAATDQYRTAFDDSDFVQAIDGTMSLTTAAQGKFSFKVMNEESSNFKGDFKALEQRLGTLIGQGLLSESNALNIREQVKTRQAARLLTQPDIKTGALPSIDWEDKLGGVLGSAPSTGDEVIAEVNRLGGLFTKVGHMDLLSLVSATRSAVLSGDRSIVTELVAELGESGPQKFPEELAKFYTLLDTAIDERGKGTVTELVHSSMYPVANTELLGDAMARVSSQITQLVALGSTAPAVLNRITTLTLQKSELSTLADSAASGYSEYLPYQQYFAGVMTGTAAEALGSLAGLPKDVAGKRDVAWSEQYDIAIDAADVGHKFGAAYGASRTLLDSNRPTIGKQTEGGDKESVLKAKALINGVLSRSLETKAEIKEYLKREFGAEVPSREKLETALRIDVADEYDLTGATKGRYSEIKTTEELASFVFFITAGEVSFEE